MEIYTIDKDGYIVGSKIVGKDCVLSEFDFNGKAPFVNGYHHITGVKKPKTKEQMNKEEVQELNQWLDLRRNVNHPDKAAKQARLLEILG